MSYRNYFYSISKKEYNKIKSLTKEEFFDLYRGLYDIGTELYDFGGNVDFKLPKNNSFFKKKEMKEFYEKYELKIITPEDLKYIIEHYKNKISEDYNQMINPFIDSEFSKSMKKVYSNSTINSVYDFSKITQEEQNSLFKILYHMRAFNTEWNELNPYNLENDSPEITTSWKYEYAIFDLIRIYKTFDWKKNIMYYFGY